MFPYRVPEAKRLRLIVDTDAKNEADDQYAIAHALLTPRFQIAGIVAAHFGERRTQRSMEESYEEIVKMVALAERTSDVAVYRGAARALPDDGTPQPSEGAELIVREAMKDDPLPLYAIFLGPLTDLASAYLMEPRIAGRLTAVWIGGGAYPDGEREFNLENDIAAANVVFQSPIELWQVPRNVYTMMRASLAELAVKVRPHGELGRYLFEQLEQFNRLPQHGPAWPKGEMWALGDTPAVSLLIDDQPYDCDVVPAPFIRGDMRYEPRPDGRPIRVYRRVDARFALEDLYAKLELFATGRRQTS